MVTTEYFLARDGYLLEYLSYRAACRDFNSGLGKAESWAVREQIYPLLNS